LLSRFNMSYVGVGPGSSGGSGMGCHSWTPRISSIGSPSWSHSKGAYSA
jgi:hypothetical protein